MPDTARSARARALQDARGFGLRPHHYPHWHATVARGEALPWLEVMSDNYLFQRGGPGLRHLDRLAAETRVLLHGVGLSIASAGPLDEDYLVALAALCRRLRPEVVSDHLCFTRAAGAQSYDLLPIPYNETTLRRVAERVRRVQDAVSAPFALENVSSYVSFRDSDDTELGFLRELCERTGCGMLLDVNNVHVSAANHGFDARAEIARVEPRHVLQYHVAGHSEADGFLHDTHDQPVREEVWDLLAFAVARIGVRPLVLERDDDACVATDVVSELDAGLAGLPARMDALEPARDQGLHRSRWNERNERNERSGGEIEPSGPSVQGTPSVRRELDEEAVQVEFLRCVQAACRASETLAGCPALLAALEPATAARLDVYRVGYFSRVTANLADTLFDTPAALLSRDVMRGLLGRYFERLPARDPKLIDSCPDLPEFVRGLSDVAEHGWIPDLLSLAIARWNVLVGADPVPAASRDPDTLRLHPAHAFLSSPHPVFSLWNAGIAMSEGVDALEIPDEAQAVLVFKSTPTDLELLLVPPELTGFVADLSLGKSVLEAIEGLDARGEEPCPDSFASFLAALSARAAFIEGRPPIHDTPGSRDPRTHP